eukprot:superscaffoldBa00001238_g9659
MEAQQNTKLEKKAGTDSRNRYRFKPVEHQVRSDLKEENAALRLNLEESQFHEHLSYCRYVAAERKVFDLKIQLKDLRSKSSNSAAEANKTIEELKHQLEQACSKDTKPFIEETHKWFEEPPAWSETSQTDLEDLEEVEMAGRVQRSSRRPWKSRLLSTEQSNRLSTTMQEKEDEWAQTEANLEIRMEDLESRMITMLDKKPKKKSWLVRLFGSRSRTAEPVS